MKKVLGSLIVIVSIFFSPVLVSAQDEIVERSKVDHPIVFTGASRFVEFSIDSLVVENSKGYMVHFTLDREPGKVWAFWETGSKNELVWLEVKQVEYDLKNNRYSYEAFVDSSKMPDSYMLHFGCDGAVSGYPNSNSITVNGNSVLLFDDGKKIVGDLSKGFHYVAKFKQDRKIDTFGVEEVLLLGYDKKYPELLKVAVVYSAPKEEFDEIKLRRNVDFTDFPLKRENFFVYDFDGKKGNYAYLLVFDTAKTGNSFTVNIDPEIGFSIDGRNVLLRNDGLSICDLSEDRSYHVR